MAILVNVAWGATPVATRLAVEDLEAMLVAVLRTGIAGLVATPLLLAIGQELPPPGRPRRLLLVSGIAGFVAFPVLFTLGQERTSATHGAMILAVLPVVTGAYALLVERRLPAVRWLAGCGLALGGEAVIVFSRAGGGDTEPTLVGDLLILAAVLVVAMGYVAGAMLALRAYRSLAVTLWGVTVGALVLWPLAGGLLAADGVPRADAAAWGSVIFLALVTSIVGYVGWYWALARGGIARIATTQFLQPVSGLVLAAAVLGERLTLRLGAGATAVLAGVWIAQSRRRAS